MRGSAFAAACLLALAADSTSAAALRTAGAGNPGMLRVPRAGAAGSRPRLAPPGRALAAVSLPAPVLSPSLGAAAALRDATATPAALPAAPAAAYAAPASVLPVTAGRSIARMRQVVARRLAGDSPVAAILKAGSRGDLRALSTRLGTFMDGSGARPETAAPVPSQRAAFTPARSPRPGLLAAPRDGLSEPGAPAFRNEPAGTRDALFIGNNWEGTVDIVDPVTFARLARIDAAPDREERTPKFWSSPRRWLFFRLIRRLIGEGHDQLVDDMFPSRDGRFLYVSRPSFGDAVAIELASGRIAWRTPIAGLRADHAAISPDGKTLLVSASTARKVQAIDTETGRVVGEFPSGDQPHESVYSRDGERIYHASIGRVFIPTTSKRLDRLKGDRYFQVVDARTFAVLRRFDMRAKLEEFGLPWIDSAVRPMAEAPDGRFVYLQISFLHGFVEFDLQQEKVTRVAFLPVGESARKLPYRKYPLNSAHHGIAMSPDGTKLVVAGSVSDYAAVVDRESFAYATIPVGKRPYWVTVSPDGRYAYLSVSGEDRVSVISLADAREVARIPVGAHPQRVRWGKVRLG